MEQQANGGQQAADGGRPGFSGGRTEPASTLSETSVDVSSAYPAVVPGTGASAQDDEATLPPVPEGAVLSEPAAPEIATGETPGEETGEKTVAFRFLGDGIDQEIDVPSEEGPLSFEGVMLALVDAAVEADKGGAPLTGNSVAQIFCRGDVEDPRVEFLLLLLAQDRPVDAALVLAAAKATEGLEGLVERAIVEREELDRASDVSVEQLNGAGVFVPLEAARAAAAQASASEQVKP